MTRQLASVLSYAAQILIVLAAVGGYFLTMSHHGDTSSYLGAVLPVLGGLGIVARLEARSDKQDSALTQITNQTNGVLDGRIRNGVRDVLAELHLGTGKVDSPNAAAPVAPVAPPVFVVPPVTVSEAGAHAPSQAAPIAVPAPIVPEPLPDAAAPVQTPVPVELGEEVLEALAAIVAKHQTGA